MEAFREGFCKTMDYSPGTSFQLSFDDDHEPPSEMTDSLAPSTRVSWKVPPVSLDQVETLSFEGTVHNDIEAGTGAAGDMVDEPNISQTPRSILEQPDIKDALNKYVNFYYYQM